MSEFDVAIIGGGPAGATCGTLLRKYNPRLRVLILERERFPRDHVGESQLPVIGSVLDEMGVWDKVEQADFPIKIGATYRWGRSDELWNFEFVEEGFRAQPRPGRFDGQRTRTAFQVDRAIYDDILLRHAAECGCVVKQETGVRKVLRNGDRVEALVLDDGSEVKARFYVDASGHAGILRRTMDVKTECPTTLQNIAIWDYWKNAEWASTVGVGGTRVLVLSQGYGWLWFIPLGPNRTSLGLIVPAEYYKASGKRPEELYEKAIREDPVVSKLIRNATCEEHLTTTKDWSFLAERLSGENWFLAGECAGFADPILAAGMSLAHIGARDVAYTILSTDRGDYDAAWLRNHYSDAHRHQIRQHIRFADYWYTHNGVFTDLLDYAKDIAADAGLDLDPAAAWRWLGTGGFIDADHVGTGFGGYSMSATKRITSSFVGGSLHYEMTGLTHFRLNLEGAEKTWGADHSKGRISRHRVYVRDGRRLPNAGLCGWLIPILKDRER
ncbi:MAG TPA: NAD(P)/FAD-dependent oxidoreductase, partial [Fimbriimonas sp.]|nr:NAD(P)/FAD-dependent oxidoreductase [Fimbriimonas sp.]